MPKLSELNEVYNVTTDDYFIVVNDPNGSPSTNKITTHNLFANIPVNSAFANNLTVNTVVFADGTTMNTSPSSSILPSTGRSEGYVVTWDQVTNAAIWQAFSGVHEYTLINSANSYTVIEHDDIIFANPNSVSDNIRIVLPDNSSDVPPVTGKAYTIKNLDPGNGYKVIVTTPSGINSGSNILENPIKGTFGVSFEISQKGDVQDYIWDGNVWRHLGSQTLPVFYTSLDTYAQVVFKNASAANNASSDLVGYNNQGDEAAGDGPFIDMGINSNNYSDTTYGNVWGPSDGYLYNFGGNLIIGPQTNNSIKFLSGGTNRENVRLTINTTAISANTGVKFHMPLTTIANNATGVAGDMAWDANYVYVCVANNSWKRATLNTY